MRSRLLAAAAAAMIALAAAPGHAQEGGPAHAAQTKAGPTLATAQGRTLYTFTRDMEGYSNCNDDCAAAWPPLLAEGEAKAGGDWSIILRDDGRRQWAYKGKALYTSVKDSQPGDAAGDGEAGGKWHVARP